MQKKVNLKGQLAKLPYDLINEIGKTMINYVDYVRLQSTCKSLKSMLPKMPNHQLSQVPWLMLPHDNGRENTRFSFLNPLENKMYNLDIPEDLAFFRECFIQKVVLLSNPTSNEFTAMAIYGELREFAFCRSGDKKWSKLMVPQFADNVLSYEGKFYVLSCTKEVWIGDATSLPKMTRIAPPCFDPNDCWLVRMSSDQSRFKWIKVTSIGDDAFFIGKNNSLFISSQNLPNDWRKNCIYFSNAYIEGHIDGIVGGYNNVMYNLKTRRIESIPGYVASDSLLVSPAPIWVTPNPTL
ncbi:hypothetical protein FH972_007728 [Carpinus fangiana]|uniref:KIB1-4 beta-propeller domain-containing protein n=1 Tax=Carpinus fangiana TaxID=176857 RepID=A0A5N6QXC8_9ROSI|nr:hypothetical protein FH972_007728 [Carpinus fangiana]